MIRPVTHQQLQSPQKSRTNSLLLSTSPSKHSSLSKSPIKKHLQNAEAFAVKLTSAAGELSRPPSSPLHGPLKAKLRASVLQSVLRLLDQDVNALAGAHEVLQAAASLPLADPRVQRACVQALRELQDSSMTSSSSSTNSYETPIPPSSPQKQAMKSVQIRSSGRAKSLLQGSLHHCKEFLLACANEIHELEDDHPLNFDYAEDIASSINLAPSESPSDKTCKHCGAANFDYASTALESSDGSLDDEDDQRSPLSKVLYQAEFMGEVEPMNATMSMRDRIICRQIMRAMHKHVQSLRRRSSASTLAIKFRVFEALKLQANITSKRFAFHRLKRSLQSRPQQLSTPSNMVLKRRSNSLAIQSLILHHSDVLLLLLGLVFLANLPAKYIM